MKRFSPLVMLLTLSLILLGACSHAGSNEESADATEEKSVETLAEEWADSVTENMTERELIGQLFMPAVYSRLEPQDSVRLRIYADSLHVGGILLLQGDVESASEVAERFSHLCQVAPWIAIDAEWGLGMRLEDAPRFPRNADLPADMSLMYDYGEEVARECRAIGINMVMGPVADISGHGDFIGSRSFGKDPQKVADLVTAYAKGMEAGGVISVAKHFPGHGRGRADSHRVTPTVETSRDSLEMTDLYPFRRYADEDLSGIMAGHLAVPSIDSTGRPAAVSHKMLTGLLREDMGFRGLIITDALNMGGASGWRAADAIAAGADIVVAPTSTRKEIEEVEKRLSSGELSIKIIKDRAKRVLKYKYLFRVVGPNPRVLHRNPNRSLPEVISFGVDSLIRTLSGE